MELITLAAKPRAWSWAARLPGMALTRAISSSDRRFSTGDANELLMAMSNKPWLPTLYCCGVGNANMATPIVTERCSQKLAGRSTGL